MKCLILAALCLLLCIFVGCSQDKTNLQFDFENSVKSKNIELNGKGYSFVQGIEGQALCLKPDSGYINLNISDLMLNGANDFSIQCWIKTDSKNPTVFLSQKDFVNKGVSSQKNAGWALPHKNICWISERHNVLNRDENGRLHNFVGPAVMYPDGWKIYAVHGVRLPGWIIDNPDMISVKAIESENNSEIKRIMIEKYGQGKYLLDSGAKEICKDQFGVLYRKEINNDEPLIMVKVIDATIKNHGEPNSYFLRVPPDVKTAREAVSWTFGMKENEYIPVIET